MKTLKKTLAALSLMTLSLSSLSAADMDTHLKPNGCKGPTLCTSSPIIDGCGYYIEAGLLYEQMYFSHGDATIREVNVGGVADDFTPPAAHYHSCLMRYPFSLDPGLRVAIAKHLEHDDWTVKAAFEWLYSSARFKKSAVANTFYYPVLFEIVDSNQAVNTKMKANYYLLDVTVSRGSFMSGRMCLRPMGGLKTAWLYADSTGNWTEGANQGTEDHHETTSTKSWGIGPMFGFESNYHMCAGFSIFADMNVAVLLGSASESNANWNAIGSDGTTTGADARRWCSSGSSMFTTARTALGLQYDRDCYDDAVHVMIKVGYDGRYYNNVYSAVRPGYGGGSDTRVGRSSGDWGMSGLILTLGLDF